MFGIFDRVLNDCIQFCVFNFDTNERGGGGIFPRVLNDGWENSSSYGYSPWNLMVQGVACYTIGF